MPINLKFQKRQHTFGKVTTAIMILKGYQCIVQIQFVTKSFENEAQRGRLVQHEISFKPYRHIADKTYKGFNINLTYNLKYYLHY